LIVAAIKVMDGRDRSSVKENSNGKRKSKQPRSPPLSAACREAEESAQGTEAFQKS